MGTFARLLRAFTAPAADPREVYRGAATVGPEALGAVQSALLTLAASRAQLESRATELRLHLSGLERDARRALEAGRPDAARNALARRQIAAAELALLERQLRDAELEAERLSLVEQRLAARIESLLARERMAVARQSAAKAHVQIGEALAGISAELHGLAPDLGRAERQAEELEARAAAIDRLLGDGSIAVNGAGEVVDRAALELDLADLMRELGA